MNNYTAAISSFIRYNVVILNTLEYTMRKDKYEVRAFEARKEIIKNEITQNTPLKNCCDNSGEAGTKLVEKINELIDTIYSDSSTIVRVAGAGDAAELRVDHAQHIAVFEAVLPVYEEIRRIIVAHVNAAKKENAYEANKLDDVIAKTESFYRGLVNMLLLDEFDHLFADYNKARQEAKGAVTPQSNFIQNDIAKVVNQFNFERQNAQTITTDYYELIDPLFALIEMTNGRREVPAGKNFGVIFSDVKKIAREKTQKWELAWKPVYDKFLADFNEEIRQMQQTPTNPA